MKTNYSGHDSVYKSRRLSGSPGWDLTETIYDEFKQEVTRIIDKGHAPKTGRLLDLGCGAGNMSIWLANQNYIVSGIDIAPGAIEWAQEEANKQKLNIDFKVGDVIELKAFHTEFFDFAFDGHCLHCIIGQDRKKMLSNIWRVLKSGGYFLINSMCAPVNTELLKNYDESSYCTVYDNISTRYFGMPDDIIEEVTSVGFDMIDYEFTPVSSFEANSNLTVELRKP